MRQRNHLGLLITTLAVTAASCSGGASSAPTTSHPTAAASPSTTQAPDEPGVTFSGALPLGGPVLTGSWVRTNFGLDGLLVIPRGLVWDGSYFYLMERVAFGDMRVWRSVDALRWDELPTLGTVTTIDGPYTLMSQDGWLVAGGNRDGIATVWLYEGDGWREVSLGVSASVTDLAVAGSNLVALAYMRGPSTVEGEFDPHPPSHTTIWVSPDGLAWTEVAGVDLFGEDSNPVGLVQFNDLVVAVANRRERVDGALNRIAPLLVTSSNGSDWVDLGYDLGKVNIERVNGGESITLISRTRIWQTTDRESWTRSTIDLSTIEESARDRPNLLQGRVVVTGAVLGNDARFGEVEFPAAWSYLGDGEWQELGVAEALSGSGAIGTFIVGDDRLVANGFIATADSPDGGWALYTFVMEPSLQDAGLDP